MKSLAKQEESRYTVEQAAPAAAVKPATSAKIEPLAPARYKVEFTASEELRNKLKRLEALMPGNDLADVVEAAVTEKLERLEAKRYGKTTKPRKSVEDADTSPGVRGIAAPVKRTVWERDGGQCTFVSGAGKRCPEHRRLEFHHDEPYALGGDRSPANIRLLCRAHNAHMAELDYGKTKMDPFRVCEPNPVYGASPKRVNTGVANPIFVGILQEQVQFSPGQPINRKSHSDKL